MKVKKWKKKTFPLYPYQLQGQQALPKCKPISVVCSSEGKIHDTIASPNHLGCQLEMGLASHFIQHDNSYLWTVIAVVVLL